MFCARKIFFDGAEGVGSRFHVLRFQISFQWYRGCRVLFSCFVASQLVFGGTEGVSCFARPNSLSAVPRDSTPILMFCAPELVFGGIEGVGSRFHVFHARTHFWRYRGRSIPFSCFPLRTCFWRCGGRRVTFPCFVLPDTFSAIPRALGPVFMFCTPRLFFSVTEGVDSRFYIFFIPGLVFSWYR
jgi:hypothetical protein